MKKLFYSIGALTVAATPVVAVVSCGGKKISNAGSSTRSGIIVGSEGQQINTTSKVEDITSRLEQGNILRNSLGSRYDNYSLYPIAPWIQSSLVSGYNNSEMSSATFSFTTGSGLVLDKYVPEFGNYLKESYSKDLPMFSASITNTGVTDYKSLDFRLALEKNDTSPMLSNSEASVSANGLAEAFNKFFDKVDEYIAEMEKRISASLSEISTIYGKQVTTVAEAAQVLRAAPAHSTLASNWSHACHVFDVLKTWNKKEITYQLDKQTDGSYKIKAFFISNLSGLENGFPIHSRTELVAGDGDLSIPGVERHLSKYLSLPETFKDFTRYEGSMRFGREEVQEYHLNEKGLWKDAGGHYVDGYSSGQGWNRFNGNFEIFTDVFPSFGQDYSHPGKLEVNFMISDSRFKGLTDYYHFGTIDGVDFSKNPMSATSTPADPAAAKSAIISLSNAMKNMGQHDKQEIVKYLDSSLVHDLENVLPTPETQAFLNAHIDDILAQWVANPALDATILAKQGSVFAAPTSSNIFMWLLGDKHEKWNLMLGLRFLQWYVKTNMPKTQA